MLENPSVVKHTVQRLLVDFQSFASITTAQLQNAPVSLKGSLVPISMASSYPQSSTTGKRLSAPL